MPIFALQMDAMSQVYYMAEDSLDSLAHSDENTTIILIQ